MNTQNQTHFGFEKVAEAEKALGIRVELVVFDTFSLMLGAGEESSNRDVTRVVNNIRLALDGRSAACIHHTGHGDKTRERGAYQIRANADKLYASRRPAGKNASSKAEEPAEAAKDAKEPVVKAPARSSESELDIMVED